MFSFFRKKPEHDLLEALEISRRAFEAGLQAGIEMVRIAARHEDDDEKLHHVADRMQAVLHEFNEKHDD